MNQGIEAYYKYLLARLPGKGYNQILAAKPLQLAFFGHGALGLPYLIAVKYMRDTTDSPKQILGQVEKWIKQYVNAGNGNGLIMFVYDRIYATDLDEIQSISGIIYGGAHDLVTGKHWLSAFWGTDLYDD